MALNQNHSSQAYQIGRLFAVLERVQEASAPDLNATIRDRYYGAASTSPISVFTQLLRLKNHHLAKLERGHVIHYEKLIGEITEKIDAFPAHMNIKEQGYFSIGYYHQRQDFFKAKENKMSNNTEEEL